MLMQTIWRQPLLHFFALGAAIFALNAVFDDAPVVPDKPVIEVSQQDAVWLVDQFQATWRRPPSAVELAGLMEDFIREEIYVREALALGLDQGDTIVRRRLRQKMEFLTEAGAEAAAPSDAVLQAHLEAKADTFARAPRVAFEQILLADASPELVAAVLDALHAGRDPASIARPSLLPSHVPPSPPQTVNGIFGSEFFASIAELDIGAWSGPVRSGFGTHLVKVSRFEAGSVPALDEIRDRVELDWRATLARDLRTQRLQDLKGQYVITMPDPEAVLAQ